MSAPTVVRRELKNARLYFIPSGETVDAVTVTAGAWPDNVPTTNWTAYELPEIEDVKSVNTIVKDGPFKIPDPNGGGYIDDEEEMVTKRMWTATTHRTNNYIKQLQHGLASAPAVGTALAAGLTKDNFLDGVMLLVVTKKDGTIIERTQVWSRLRLTTAGDIGPATAKVEFSLEQRPSTLNTYLLVA